MTLSSRYLVYVQSVSQSVWCTSHSFGPRRVCGDFKVIPTKWGLRECFAVGLVRRVLTPATQIFTRSGVTKRSDTPKRETGVKALC